MTCRSPIIKRRVSIIMPLQQRILSTQKNVYIHIYIYRVHIILCIYTYIYQPSPTTSHPWHPTVHCPPPPLYIHFRAVDCVPVTRIHGGNGRGKSGFITDDGSWNEQELYKYIYQHLVTFYKVTSTWFLLGKCRSMLANIPVPWTQWVKHDPPSQPRPIHWK